MQVAASNGKYKHQGFSVQRYSTKTLFTSVTQNQTDAMQANFDSFYNW